MYKLIVNWDMQEIITTKDNFEELCKLAKMYIDKGCTIEICLNDE